MGVVCSSSRGAGSGQRAAGRGKELQGTTPVPLPASFPSGVCTLIRASSANDRVCVLCVVVDGGRGRLFFCRGRFGGELMSRGARFGPTAHRGVGSCTVYDIRDGAAGYGVLGQDRGSPLFALVTAV